MSNELVKKGVLLGVRGIVLYVTVPSILIGLGCLAAGLFSGYVTYLERKTNVEVTGVITDTSPAAGIRYTDAGGQVVDARSHNSISPSPYHVGQEVKAYVNPSDPKDVSVESFAETWSVTLFLLVFGTMFTLIPGIILKVFWKVTSMAKQAMENPSMPSGRMSEPTASKPNEPGAPPTNPVTWV